jgi:hypothetical protein
MDPHPIHRADPPAPGVIEVRLNTLSQLFNSMDPTPFPAKDLDQDAEEFIVGWAMEHPKQAALELRLHLSESPGDARGVEQAIHHYFSYKAGLASRRLRHLISRGRWSLAIGLTFLTACLGAADLSQRLGQGPLFQIIREGFIIAGWVAMWKPMEIFLYDWWPIRHERTIYHRLSAARVTLADDVDRTGGSIQSQPRTTRQQPPG